MFFAHSRHLLPPAPDSKRTSLCGSSGCKAGLPPYLPEKSADNRRRQCALIRVAEASIDIDLPLAATYFTFLLRQSGAVPMRLWKGKRAKDAWGSISLR